MRQIKVLILQLYFGHLQVNLCVCAFIDDGKKKGKKKRKGKRGRKKGNGVIVINRRCTKYDPIEECAVTQRTVDCNKNALAAIQMMMMMVMADSASGLPPPPPPSSSRLGPPVINSVHHQHKQADHQPTNLSVLVVVRQRVLVHLQRLSIVPGKAAQHVGQLFA